METPSPLVNEIDQQNTSVITIRCLSAVPQEIEDLLAKIAAEEEQVDEQTK